MTYWKFPNRYNQEVKNDNASFFNKHSAGIK